MRTVLSKQPRHYSVLNAFQGLDAVKRRTLIQRLPSSQRYKLHELVRSGARAQMDPKSMNAIMDQIKVVQNLTPAITRSDERLSWLTICINAILDQLSNIALLFHFLTARKAENLINKILLKRACGADPKRPCINQDDLQKLIQHAQKQAPGKVLDLKKLLSDHGYSSRIAHLHFTEEISFKNLNLSKIQFIDCEFTGCHFSDSTLSDVSFEFCQFNQTSFMNADLKKVLYNECEIRSSSFICARLKEVSFLKSGIIDSSFEDAQLEKCLFSKVCLPATHFLQAHVHECHIRQSDLKEAVFFESLPQFFIDTETEKTVKITKPITAILTHPEIRGITTPKAHLKIDQSAHNIPLRIAFNTPKVKLESVNQETEKILRKIGSHNPDGPSIAKRLVQEVQANPDLYPSSAYILSKAQKLGLHVNSFFLTGGEDVPPALYGQKCESKTNWGDDYRRSILEIGLVHESFQKGIPLMAVCRGFHIASVYFGNQLEQHVKNQDGIQEIKLLSEKFEGLFGRVIKQPITTASSHHQAVFHKTFNRQHLEPITVYDGLVKGAEIKYGSSVPMLLLQFHPEFHKAPTAHCISGEFIDFFTSAFMDENNEKFWQILHDSAEQHRKQKSLIEELKLNFSTKQ